MTAHSVELQNVCKTYKTSLPDKNILRALFLPPQKHQQPVFNALNLRIEPREKVLIYAKNGTGKTTLLRLIAGFTKADSGEVRIDNKASDTLSRSEIGIMLEHFFLYTNVSILENMRFNAALHRMTDVEENVQSSLRQWQLESIAEKLVSQVSNGQKSLVALARSTIHKPKLLLWDEPQVFLSEDNFRILDSFIANSPQTIIVTSAIRFESAVFDRVIHL